MENLKINIQRTLGFINKNELDSLKEKVYSNINSLYNKTGKGNDFLGWVKLPEEITDKDLKRIETLSASLETKVDIVIVTGIGGSYLGTKAIIEALSSSFKQLTHFSSDNHRKAPLLLFAGQNLGEDYLSELLEVLDKKRYAIVVISKSGTTTEPAIAFRILKKHLEKKEGKENAKKLIIAVTDEKKGALKKMADDEGYETFVIPDDVGGRYSVLTPVGLLPLAIGGVDIRNMVEGARTMMKLTDSNSKFEDNPAAIYAATRYLLYKSGKKIEILANFENKLHYFAEWWKQLYGESEGKDGKGIFPASVDFTADLHSMGQYIQEGERILMETVISVKNPFKKLSIESENENLDGLNFLAGKRVDEVNKMAELGTALAHVDGGVPNILIQIPEINEYYLGQLIYFFEIACGISGYLLEVNPFDQPGVEAYKKNMFALLGKPGFEAESKKIKERI